MNWLQQIGISHEIAYSVMLLSLVAILYQASRPYIAVLGRIPGDPPVYADADRHATAVPPILCLAGKA